MKLKEYQIVLAAVFLPLFLLWGCQSNKLVSPVRIVDMGVAISTEGLKSKLFNTSEDMVYYNVSGPLSAPITGTAGPFSSPLGSGSVSFTLNNVPVGSGEILSVELDDATSGIPQGIGATALTDVVNGVTVDMGSLVRNCYSFAANSSFSCDDTPQAFFGFNAEQVSTSNNTLVYDMEWVGLKDSSSNCTGGYDLEDGSTGTANSIAYLGNGKLVNFDTVPPDASFESDGGLAKSNAGVPTTIIAAGDIFCVKLLGETPIGHAWVLFNGAGSALVSPSFVYRVRNDAIPYYQLDVTAEDSSQTTGSFSNCTITEFLP
jgi:hypothetical protein